jgi:hypothetical protein
MRNSIYRCCRRATTVLGAGVLLQAGGCVSNPSELFGGLVSSVVNSAIANFVFGAFGLAI